MARFPRIDLPGIAQHIVQRGNDRQACFVCESDYTGYLCELGEAAIKHGCAIHAFVLMTNHVHLLAIPDGQGAVSRMMQAIGRRYVGRFNARYGAQVRSGKDAIRPRSSAAHAMRLPAIATSNSTRCAHRWSHSPSDYRWSSYRHNALAIEQPFIAAHKSYLALAHTDAQRRERYRGLVAAQLDACDIDAIRIHTQQQRVYGSDRFRQQIQSLTQRATTIKPRGRPRLSEPTTDK